MGYTIDMLGRGGANKRSRIMAVLSHMSARSADPVLQETMRLGGLRDVDQVFRYATMIRDEIVGGPHRTIFQVFDSLRSDHMFARDVRQLNRTLIGSGDPYASTVFQSLVWLMRASPKTDCHYHLSRNLHESEIADLVIDTAKKDKDAYIRMKRNLPDNCGFADEMEAYVASGDSGSLSQLFIRCGLLESKKTDDFYVTNPDILKLAVRAACLRGLQDGVTSFDIRLNPVKDDLFTEKGSPHTEAEWADRILRCVDAANAGIAEAISGARKKRYIDKGLFPNIGIMFSMSRNKAPYLISGSKDSMSSEEMALFALETCCRERDPIAGVDVSDNEYSILDYGAMRINGWEPFFDLAAAQGLKTVAHIGDFRYARDSKSIEAAVVGLKAAYLAGDYETYEKGMVEIVGQYIPFVEGFLRIMPRGSGIGHGYILDPSFLVTPIWDSKVVKWVDVLSMDETGELTRRLEKLRQTAKEKFVIETCPPSTLRGYTDMGSYGELSVHRWLKQGFRVSLGTDSGVFSFNRPRVLSDVISRLLLSGGNGVNGSSLSVAAVLGMIGYDI